MSCSKDYGKVLSVNFLTNERLRFLQAFNVTEQVVAGKSFVVNGIFEDVGGDKFQCEMTLWERSWMPEPNNIILQLKSKVNFVGESF